MTAPLSSHCALLTEAPGGIERLRRLVRRLAVLGRLTVVDEVPNAFDGWRSAKFGEVFRLEYGENLPAPKRSGTGEFPVYGSNGVVGSHDEACVHAPCLVVGRKGSAGAVNLCEHHGCWVTDVAYYCVPPPDISLRFSYLLFLTLGLDALGEGIKPGLSRSEANVLPIGVPPSAEQDRIVTKVDELMALCDQLEARQQAAKAAHTRLVQALLDSLTQVQDADEFQACWRRMARVFPEALSSDAAVDQLRGVVQQLGVMGRLTSRAPGDGSGAALLAEITAFELNATTTGRRRVKVGAAPREVPYDLPAEWCWSTAEQVCEVIVDCPHSTPTFVPSGVLCLDTNSVKQGRIVPERTRYVDEATFTERVARLTPRSGDVVFAREGSVGESVVIPPGLRCCLGQRVMLLRPRLLAPAYLKLALSEPSAVARQLDMHKGIGAKHVNVADMRTAWVPLPPLAEQRSIVARVSELLAFCDQLKARLAATRTKHGQLAQALVEAALA